MSTESQLREKLRKIEALFAGAGTAGEPVAVDRWTTLGGCAKIRAHSGLRSDITQGPISAKRRQCMHHFLCISSANLFFLNVSQILDDIQYSFSNNLLRVARHIQQ